MIKIGITGQSGFIGTHLYNTIGLYPGSFDRINFKDDFFDNTGSLGSFVANCDVIVHLAAMNRHNSPEELYQTNVGLVKKLISACEGSGSRPHIIYSSSTQEERDNLYGRSKREGRKLFEEWAAANNASFSGLIIPNVYGPFGQPYYNSVVATFCHQLTHNEIPSIDVDGEMKLIYVGELVDHIIELAGASGNWKHERPEIKEVRINHTYEIRVSVLLEILSGFRNNYFSYGIIPSLESGFFRNLFNTFVCYIDHKSFFPFKLELKRDDRGSFVETVKLNSGGQVSFSTTRPGITRGNHFHTRKAERFAVIRGKAQINLRRIGTDKVLSFNLDGEKPSFVDMPVWYTHNITNTGNEDLYTIFWINEHFDESDPDTFFERV